MKVLLSIATHLNYEIWKLNIKIAFLNDYLDDSIYMMQPNIFIAKSQEHLVCKLHTSIYGLVQVSLSWSEYLD